MTTQIPIIMSGALGRMGRNILTLAAADDRFTIAGAVDRTCADTGRDIGEIIGIGTVGQPLTDNLASIAKPGVVVIDFTWTEQIPRTAAICVEAGSSLVMGTTGMNPSERDVFARTVASIPCVFAPNMSVGVNVLFKIAAETARILGDDYDVEIAEVHHRFKKDAPSGTAVKLGEVIAEALGREYAAEARHGRQGITGERTRTEIGMHALRLGDVVGEHTVSFGTIGERIELTHRAHSRDALAKGAIRAALFIAGAAPGLYDMQDVLGLK